MVNRKLHNNERVLNAVWHFMNEDLMGVGMPRRLIMLKLHAIPNMNDNHPVMLALEEDEHWRELNERRWW